MAEVGDVEGAPAEGRVAQGPQAQGVRMEGAAAECVPPEGASGQGALAISARGFSFAYPPDGGPFRDGSSQDATRCALGPLDWQVDDGAFQLLVGATGSGKTTLLRNVKAAIAPSGTRTGALEVFGTPVEQLGAADAASLVGYVAQSPDNQIVCDTVWHELAFGLENLGVPQDAMRRRVAEVAHFFGIEPWFHREVARLSGGQRQMVTLAGVLAMQPRILLLDEPTAQLDPVSEKSFLHALFRVNRELGITVVVATHAPETMVAYATDAVEIADGQVRHVPVQRFAAVALEVASVRDTASCGKAAEKPAFVLRDVFFRYGRGEEWVLRGRSLQVAQGGMHALVGGNGSGKTTLLHVAAGVLVPERGRVRNCLATSQAMLPQNPKALFVCDTVDEELREWQSACGFGDEDIRAVQRRCGLSGMGARHPFDLSGGQQQLLAFAKLLLTRPSLMFLDEPTKGLDAVSKLTLARELRAAVDAGVTAVLATHDLSFVVCVCDVATMLFDGEDACTQPVSEFFADNLFYQPAEDAFVRAWACDRKLQQ